MLFDDTVHVHVKGFSTQIACGSDVRCGRKYFTVSNDGRTGENPALQYKKE